MSQHEYMKQFNSKTLDGAIHQDTDFTTPYLSDYAHSLQQNPKQLIPP
jgi:hypothetical protein